MPRQMTWEQAIEQVLTESQTPLHYGEITERIINRGLRLPEALRIGVRLLRML